MDEQERYQRAKKRVEDLRGFYKHFAVFMLVNPGLIALNLLSSRHGLWWPWATFGWGIGLAAHAASVFVFPNFLSPEWEERKIKEIMERNSAPPKP
jgi:hypothetical protein